jgi:hypothetical protein
MSTRNIPGAKGGRCVRLTTSPPSCAECHEIWEPKPSETLWATPGLLRDSFKNRTICGTMWNYIGLNVGLHVNYLWYCMWDYIWDYMENHMWLLSGENWQLCEFTKTSLLHRPSRMETIHYEDLRRTEGQRERDVTASNDDGFRTGGTFCPEVPRVWTVHSGSLSRWRKVIISQLTSKFPPCMECQVVNHLHRNQPPSPIYIQMNSVHTTCPVQ